MLAETSYGLFKDFEAVRKDGWMASDGILSTGTQIAAISCLKPTARIKVIIHLG